jgi:hypothetical protein
LKSIFVAKVIFECRIASIGLGVGLGREDRKRKTQTSTKERKTQTSTNAAEKATKAEIRSDGKYGKSLLLLA